MTVPADPRVPKTVLVTGGAKRIGKAIAIALGGAGWNVGVHYHGSAGDAYEVVDAIRDAGGNAVALQADLASEQDTETLISRTEAALGTVGCLINNASTFENDLAGTVTRESWDQHLEPNLRAPFVLSQHLEKALPPEARGVIINMLDQRVWNLTPYFISYTLSKAGLWALTQTLALAWAPRIRVNAIGPGPVLPSKRQTQEQFAQICEAAPLQQGTSPAEIADAIFFILRATAMTGVMIPLDGGQHLGWAQPKAPAPSE